jgi:ferredoxin
VENIDIYYFTGTGNTLYILKMLKEHIPEIRLIPVVSLLNDDSKVYSESKTIGFCFPNHAGHLPIPMKKFIKRLHLQGNEYLFSICNSAFSKSFAHIEINKFLKKNNGRLSSHFNLIMPDNHMIVTKNYRIPTKEELLRCENQLQKSLIHVIDVINNRELYDDKDTRAAPFPMFIDKVLRPMVFYLIEEYPSIVLKDAFYSDLKCTGCAICEKVCPADRIAIVDERPVFNIEKTCFGCYACLNFCPAESLQAGSKWYNGRSYTAENGRYPHPYASADDISKQKVRNSQI